MFSAVLLYLQVYHTVSYNPNSWLSLRRLGDSPYNKVRVITAAPPVAANNDVNSWEAHEFENATILTHEETDPVQQRTNVTVIRATRLPSSAPPLFRSIITPKPGMSPFSQSPFNSSSSSSPFSVSVKKRTAEKPSQSHLQTFAFTALDCRQPTMLSSTAVEDACKTRARPHKVLSSHLVMLVQKLPSRRRRSVRCMKQVSTFDAICGSFSHTKIMEPPSILVPEPVSEQVCEQVAKTGLYVDETGRSHMVSGHHGVLHYKFVSQGTLTYSTNNVFCEGSQVKIQGSLHTDVLELRSVRISIMEVEVNIRSDGRIQDSEDQEELPSMCKEGHSCTTGVKTFVFLDSPDVCPYKIIQKTHADLVQGHIAGKPRKLLYSNTTKIVVPLAREAVAAPAACQHAFRQLVPTADPELYVIFTEDLINANSLSRVAGPDIDLDLEDRLADNYVEYDIRKTLDEKLLTLGQSLCKLAEGSWTRMERSPFHPLQMIRRRGEVLQEIRCSSTPVYATEGDSLNNKCYLNALPVRLGTEFLLMQAGSRLLTTPDGISEVPCSAVNSPLFITADRRVLVADPIVRVLTMKLDGHGNTSTPLLHALDMMTQTTDDQVFTDILYSPAEVASFSEYLHFSRVKEAVQTHLVGDYCHSSGSSDCGAYSPQPGYNLDLAAIKDITYTPYAWLNDVLEETRHIGAYAGFVFLVWFVLMTIRTFIKTVKLRLEGFFWRDSFQIARGLPRSDVPTRPPGPVIVDNEPPRSSQRRLRRHRADVLPEMEAFETDSIPLEPRRTSPYVPTTALPLTLPSSPPEYNHLLPRSSGTETRYTPTPTKMTSSLMGQE